MLKQVDKIRHVYRYLFILPVLIAVAVVYGQTAKFPFINYDDPIYVTENPIVRAGLTLGGIRWAFTTTVSANWHPLTWLSHMLDMEIFGLDPGWHHVVSVIFHLVNSALLFYVLCRMTNAHGRSVVVAALFALHPLHVESVVWVAERKDVLSAFFFFLTLWSYLRFVARPGVLRYLLIVLLMGAGLMSKPMLVTLPFVLILLDYWPLRRLALREPLPGADELPLARSCSPGRLLLEKAPLLVLSIIFSLITYSAQNELRIMGNLPLWFRIANAVISYMAYIGKTIWPSSLAIFYPHPGYSLNVVISVMFWKVAGAGLLLCVATGLAVIKARRYPYLITGWLWYLVTLIPVIGIVQVGSQAMADRYTYIPLIGLFVAAVWGVAELAEKSRLHIEMVASATVTLVAVYAILCWIQVGYWRGPGPLFSHALEVTGDSSVAHDFLGEDALENQQYEQATTHFRSAIRVNPFDTAARNNLGLALLKLGRSNEAELVLTEAVRMDPDDSLIRFNLGMALSGQGRSDEAAKQFQESNRFRGESK